MPTVRQVFVAGHEIAPRFVASDVLGLGLDSTLQPLPFQCSTNVFSVLPLLPTAKQLLVLGHATPSSCASFPGLGLVITPQLLPFQCSTRVFTAPPVEYPLTAKQLVVLGHAIAESAALEVGRVGLDIVDQVVPFQRAISALPTPFFV